MLTVNNVGVLCLLLDDARRIEMPNDNSNLRIRPTNQVRFFFRPDQSGDNPFGVLVRDEREKVPSKVASYASANSSGTVSSERVSLQTKCETLTRRLS